MRALVLGALVLAGCTDERIHVRVIASEGQDGSRLEQEQLVRDAAEMLGREAVFDTHQIGSVSVMITDTDDLIVDDGDTVGITIVHSGCTRSVAAVADVSVIAHEIGHALGLDHVDDDGSVMLARTPVEPDPLTDQQDEIVSDELRKLELCRVRRK